MGSRVGPRVGPLRTSCGRVLPGPYYALQFPALTKTRKLWEQVGGLPKMEFRGKRGSWVVCDLFRLREWKFSVAREGFRRTSTLPVGREGSREPLEAGGP